MALKMILKKLNNIDIAESKCLLRGYLSADETDIKDVLGMTIDTLLGGVDTVILLLNYIYFS